MAHTLIKYATLVLGSSICFAILKALLSFVVKPFKDDLEEAWRKVAKSQTEHWHERFMFFRMLRRHRRNKMLRLFSTDPIRLIEFLVWPVFFSFQALFAQYQSASPTITIVSGPQFHYFFNLFMAYYPDGAYLVASYSWFRTFYLLARSKDEQYLERQMDRTDKDIQKYLKRFRPDLLPKVENQTETVTRGTATS